MIVFTLLAPATLPRRSYRKGACLRVPDGEAAVTRQLLQAAGAAFRETVEPDRVRTAAAAPLEEPAAADVVDVAAEPSDAPAPPADAESEPSRPPRKGR